MNMAIPSNLIPKVIRYLTKGLSPQTQDVRIAEIAVGKKQPCFFIAEIGINHNGST